MCPIPGDNGNPEKERAAQEARIREVAEKGGDVVGDLKKIESNSQSDFGRVQ